MIRKLPKQLPTMAAMLADIQATPAQTAKALGVSVSTVYRWAATNRAPRIARLAIYWCTRWGQSDIDAELWNRAQTYQGFAECLSREISTLIDHIEDLGKIGDYGSANDPAPHIGRRFSLDGAETFRAVQGLELATISHDTQRPKVLQAKR